MSMTTLASLLNGDIILTMGWIQRLPPFWRGALLGMIFGALAMMIFFVLAFGSLIAALVGLVFGAVAGFQIHWYVHRAAKSDKEEWEREHRG
jgi:hypothetical protein